MDGAKLQSKLRNLSKSQLLTTGNSLNSALAIGTLGLWVLRGLCKFPRKQISVGGMQSAFYRLFNFFNVLQADILYRKCPWTAGTRPGL